MKKYDDELMTEIAAELVKGRLSLEQIAALYGLDTELVRARMIGFMFTDRLPVSLDEFCRRVGTPEEAGAPAHTAAPAGHDDPDDGYEPMDDDEYAGMTEEEYANSEGFTLDDDCNWIPLEGF